MAVYHSREYLEIVLRSEKNSDGLLGTVAFEENLAGFGLEDDCPRFTDLSEYIRMVAGATLTATNALRLGYADNAISWDGGR